MTNERQQTPEEKKKTEERRKKAMEELRAGMTRMAAEFKSCLPAHISEAKFVRTVLTGVQNTPSLLDCNRATLYAASMQCAQSGLIPDGDEAALIPFKGSVKFIPMTRGLLKLIRNSGELKAINPYVVYEGDEFDHYVDENGPHLKHRPNTEKEGGKVTHAYVIAKTKDEAIYMEVMTRRQIEQIRNCSQQKDKGPWKDWYDEQAKKSVIRRLSKRLPKSTDLENALRADDELYNLPSLNGGEAAPATPQATKPKRAGEIVNGGKPKEAAPAQEQNKPAPRDEDVPVEAGGEQTL